jgi:hypothetical protein
MADIASILSSNYLTVGANLTTGNAKYINVDPASFEGRWAGKYANGQPFAVSISGVSGFRAKAKYQSGNVLKYQDVLIRDNSFRVGDTKFTLTRPGRAQIKSVIADPATGGSTLETAFSSRD